MNPLRLVVLFSALLLATFTLMDQPHADVTGLVLYSAADTDVRDAVRALQQAGVATTTKPASLTARAGRGLQVVVLTTSVLPSVDRDAVGRAYADGALLVGLDVSLRELESLVFGRPTSAERAPARPLFSMLHGDVRPDGCGGSGSFEDTLANWDVPGFVLHRAHEVAFERNSCK